MIERLQGSVERGGKGGRVVGIHAFVMQLTWKPQPSLAALSNTTNDVSLPRVTMRSAFGDTATDRTGASWTLHEKETVASSSRGLPGDTVTAASALRTCSVPL